MTIRCRRWPLALGLVALSVSLWGLPARGYTPYLDQVRAMHPTSYACSLCHDTNHQLNAFGKDFLAALATQRDPYQALRDVESLDSDGDGTPNGEELTAGSLPEDRFSRPGRVSTSH